MDSWHHSDVTYARMEGLIKRGLLRGRTDAAEWLVSGREDAPAPPDGYVVSLALLHEPDSWFLPTRSSRVCYTTIRSSCST